MSFDKITESDSNYDKLEEKSIKELLEIINSEDQTVAFSVKKEISKLKPGLSGVSSIVFRNEEKYFIGKNPEENKKIYNYFLWIIYI